MSTRDSYRRFHSIQTRWSDNDAYGHVNNVVYYAWFDTTVNAYLIERGGLDIHHGSTIGLCVESMCRYAAPLAYPQMVEVGFRVAHLGNSSVRYELGVFAKDQNESAAEGHFVHVFVNRETRKPSPIHGSLRACLEELR